MTNKKHLVEVEILSTEQSFYEGLVDLERLYMNPIFESIRSHPKKNISEKEYYAMFARISVIQGVSKQLLTALQLYINGGHPDTIGQIFLKWAPMIKTFTEYITIYETVSLSLANYRKTRSTFAHVLQDAHQRASSQKKQALSSLLITPVQRIARYPLLLREVLRHTEKSDPDYETLEIALELTTKVTDSINKSVHDYEARRKVSEVFTHTKHIQKHIPFIPSRRVILIQEMMLVKQRQWRAKTVERPRCVYLFNDMILFTKKHKYKYHCMLQTGHVTVTSHPTDSKAFFIDLEGVHYQLVTPSQEIRDKWVDQLEDRHIHTGTLLDLSFPDDLDLCNSSFVVSDSEPDWTADFTNLDFDSDYSSDMSCNRDSSRST